MKYFITSGIFISNSSKIPVDDCLSLCNVDRFVELPVSRDVNTNKRIFSFMSFELALVVVVAAAADVVAVAEFEECCSLLAGADSPFMWKRPLVIFLGLLFNYWGLFFNCNKPKNAKITQIF